METRKPGIFHLQVFESIAHIHIQDKRRAKLDEKRKKFIFINYDNNSKGYKLYNPNNRKIMINRGVIFFNEEQEWDFGSNTDDSTCIPVKKINRN